MDYAKKEKNEQGHIQEDQIEAIPIMARNINEQGHIQEDQIEEAFSIMEVDPPNVDEEVQMLPELASNEEVSGNQGPTKSCLEQYDHPQLSGHWQDLTSTDFLNNGQAILFCAIIINEQGHIQEDQIEAIPIMARNIVNRPVTIFVSLSKAGEGTTIFAITNGKGPVKADVVAKSRGEYHVTFTPKEPIPHYYISSFNGEVIPGLQFMCDVREGHDEEAQFEEGIDEGVQMIMDPICFTHQVNRPATVPVDMSGTGESILKFDITNKKGSVKADVVAKPWGRYDITFTPNEAIPHYFTSSINGKVYPGLQFIYDVREGHDEEAQVNEGIVGEAQVDQSCENVPSTSGATDAIYPGRKKVAQRHADGTWDWMTFCGKETAEFILSLPLKEMQRKVAFIKRKMRTNINRKNKERKRLPNGLTQRQ